MKKLIGTAVLLSVVIEILIINDIWNKIDNLRFLGLPTSFIFVTFFGVSALVFKIAGVLDMFSALPDFLVVSGYYFFFSIVGSYSIIEDTEFIARLSFFGALLFLIPATIVAEPIKKAKIEDGVIINFDSLYWFSVITVICSFFLFLLSFYLLR